MKQRRSGKAKAVLAQGIKLYESNDYKKALELFEEAVSHDDELGKAWYYKGLALKEFKRYADAIKALSRAGELETELKPLAFPEKGRLLVRLGCYIDAAELFFLLEQQGFDIPGLQDELGNLRSKRGVMEGLQGRAYLQGGDFQKAIIAFRNAIKQNPRDKAAWRMMGEAQERNKDYKEALKSYGKSVETGEDEVELLLPQANCMFHLKSYRKAKVCLDKLLEINPNHIHARKMRIECNDAIERGESRDADDEEDTPISIARRKKAQKEKSLKISIILISILFLTIYWSTANWRLNRGLNSADPVTVNASIFKLAEKGNTDGVTKMIELLETSTDERIRASAARALGQLNIKDAEKALITALEDKDWIVRCCAAESLGILKSKDAVEPLSELLKRDLYYGVRVKVVDALGNIRGALAVNNLLEAINDDDPSVRIAVIKQLKIVTDPSVVVTHFCSLLKDENKMVRKEVAIALGEIGSKSSMKPLQEALQVEGEDPEVKQALSEALSKLK